MKIFLGMICAGRAWHGCFHVDFTVPLGLDEKSLRHKNLGQKLGLQSFQCGGRFLFSQTRFVANVFPRTQKVW